MAKKNVSNYYKYGVYVTNTLNKDVKTNAQIVAKVTTLGDANIIASALNKAVISSPLDYTVKKLL